MNLAFHTSDSEIDIKFLLSLILFKFNLPTFF